MIEIHYITKKFNGFTALDRISFNVEKNDIFGFIGPNGAGKTTTIRILSTLIKEFEGSALIDGYDIIDNYIDARRIIGYMPDFIGVYKSMTVLEFLEFYARSYGIKNPSRNKIINDCLELTELTGKKDNIASHLSRGMTQRLLLAKTLVHNPKLLLLDEPASGLDPRARIEFKEIIKTLSSMDKTILISSHILSELSDICNSVGIIENGKIITYGSIDNIKKIIQKHRIFRIKSLNPFTDEEKKFFGTHENINSILDIKDNELDIEFTGDLEQASDLLNECFKRKIRITGFTEKESNLEDVFLNVTKGILS